MSELKDRLYEELTKLGNTYDDAAELNLETWLYRRGTPYVILIGESELSGRTYLYHTPADGKYWASIDKEVSDVELAKFKDVLDWDFSSWEPEMKEVVKGTDAKGKELKENVPTGKVFNTNLPTTSAILAKRQELQAEALKAGRVIGPELLAEIEQKTAPRLKMPAIIEAYVNQRTSSYMDQIKQKIGTSF